MALANYLASGLGEKTAYLELCGHGEVSHWKETNPKGYFTDIKIDYYPDLKREQIPILLNHPYEKIIMDFGDAYLNFREELLRCDGKIFLLGRYRTFLWLRAGTKGNKKEAGKEIRNRNYGYTSAAKPQICSCRSVPRYGFYFRESDCKKKRSKIADSHWKEEIVFTNCNCAFFG